MFNALLVIALGGIVLYLLFASTDCYSINKHVALEDGFYVIEIDGNRLIGILCWITGHVVRNISEAYTAEGIRCDRCGFRAKFSLKPDGFPDDEEETS